MEISTLHYKVLYKVLYEIAREINSTLAVEDALQVIVEGTAKAINAKGCSLMLLTPDKTQLIHRVAYGLSDWYIKKGPVVVDTAIFAALQGVPLAMLDATTDPRTQYPEQAKREGIASILSLPLMVRGGVVGVLRVYTAEPYHFSTEEIDFLSAVANLGAIALEKARLYESLGQDYERCIVEKAEVVEQTTKEVARLEEERARLLRFLAIAAHDLKAPLAAIQSYFGVLLGGFAGQLNIKQRQIIERSNERIKGLLELIIDLLDISHIEMKQIVKEKEKISLPQMLKMPLQDARSVARQKNLKLKVEIPKGLPPLFASPLLLQQVFANVLGNATKFTPPGGEVTLRIKGEGDQIRVEISDTGIGIPPEDLPRIFEDFYRASNVQVPGTGLGLAIVRRIVEAHGGKIWAESPCPETGKGSKFTFTIPVNKTKPDNHPQGGKG